MARLVEGLWDCPYCGTKGIGGLKRECPNCGKPRGEDTKFYMAGQKKYLSDDQAKKVGTRPDWYCGHCDSLNPDSATNCIGCGAPRDSSEGDYFTIRQRVEAEKAAEQRRERALTDDAEYVHHPRPTKEYECSYNVQSQTPKEHKETHHSCDAKSSSAFSVTNIGTLFRQYKQPIAFIVLIVLLISMFAFILTPKIKTGTVDGFRWERTFEVLEYKTVNESDWHLPAEARLQYTNREIKTYEKVLDHYETKTRHYSEQVFDHYDVSYSYRDNGNGTFSEQEHRTPVYRTETRTETYQEPVYRNDPVYATKYYYEIERWVHKTNVETADYGQNPVWGTYDYADNEKEGNRSEQYFLTVTLGKKSKEYSMEFEEWKSLSIGSNIKLKTYITGRAEIYNEK